MNILLLIDQSGSRWSSQEDLCLKVIRELRRQGGNCVVCYSSPPAKFVRTRLAAEGGIVEVAGRGGSLIDFCQRVNSWCRAHNISIVHLMHYPPSTTLTLLLPIFLKARVVLSDWSGGAGTAKPPLKEAFFHLFNVVMNLGICHFVTPSRFVQNRLVSFRGIPSGKVTLISNGVDLERFSPSMTRQEVRRRVNLPGDGPLLLVACNLYPLKGVDVLIRAVALVRDRVPGVYLAVAGDGPERMKLEDLAIELGISASVLFLGQRNDMPDLLVASNIFCCPSVWGEAFGWVNAEAMACGVPVVAAATGAVSEVVVHGETGLLVPPGDVRGIAQALLRLLESPEECVSMGRVGRLRAESLFDLDQNVKEHLALYQCLQLRRAGK